MMRFSQGSCQRRGGGVDATFHAVYPSADDTATLGVAVDSASSQLFASLYASGWRKVALWIALLAAAVAGVALVRRRRRRVAAQGDSPAPPAGAAAT
jgi:hypothetical protein